MNKKALIKDLNEVYNLVSDHDITEAMERLEYVISEVRQLHIPVVSGCYSLEDVKQAVNFWSMTDVDEKYIKAFFNNR